MPKAGQGRQRGVEPVRRNAEVEAGGAPGGAGVDLVGSTGDSHRFYVGAATHKVRQASAIRATVGATTMPTTAT